MKIQKSRTKTARSISPIWIVPLAALVIAAWLAIHAWQKKGTEIEIIFDTASGIEVGQTQVRLKDVPVGKVTAMRLSANLGQVIVTATLDRPISAHLSTNTRFWLVSPRVSASGVSNLGTLISGVYIVMDPGKPGDYHDVFMGLSEPPAVESDDEGTQYLLHAETLGSLDIGSPIYFRQLRVGEVTGYRLGSLGNSVEIRIWIESPNDKLVQKNSRFWNVSGVDVTVGSNGVKAEIGSLASLIGGGIAFENGFDFEQQERAPSDHEFYLFDDRDSVMEERYTLKYYYRLRFSHTIKGLDVGAPVEFRGIKVGEVLDIKLHTVNSQPEGLHVFLSIEPQRLDPEWSPTREEFDRHLAELVAHGLRASMRTGSLLTGSRFIDLAFPEAPPAGEFAVKKKFSDIPTMDSPSEDLEKQIAGIARKINQIPIDTLGQDLTVAVTQLSEILKTFNQHKTMEKFDTTMANVSDASTELTGTMQEAQAAMSQVADTLLAMEQLMAPDSSTQYQLTELMSSLNQTSTSLNRLLEQLNKKPDALIFGN